jgi:hypothetical protein
MKRKKGSARYYAQSRTTQSLDLARLGEAEKLGAGKGVLNRITLTRRPRYPLMLTPQVVQLPAQVGKHGLNGDWGRAGNQLTRGILLVTTLGQPVAHEVAAAVLWGAGLDVPDADMCPQPLAELL